MTEENDKKLYAHLTGLIKGSANTNNTVRNELIVSDAKRHLAQFIKVMKKRDPNLVFGESKEEKPKSKGNK